MLTLFLHWWAEHLGKLLPRGLRGGHSPDGVLVSLPRLIATGMVADVAVRRRDRTGQSQVLGLDRRNFARFAPQRVMLQVPAGEVLDREVQLPLAAERAPGDVLRHQIDRLTPFAENEVYWGWARQPGDRTRLVVRLVAIPASTVKPAIAALRATGVDVAGLEAILPDGSPFPVPLSHVPDTGSGGVLVPLLGALCTLLGAVAAGLPLVQQEQEARAMQAEIATLRPRVATAEALRRDLASSAAGGDVVAAERARTGAPLRALAVVTTLLPDDSFLTEFTMKTGRIELRGQSPAAARLISLFASDPSLRNPAFAAPMTRNDGGTMDLFAIRAEFVP